MGKIFGSTFEYKVIYIFELKDEKHRGLLKIGDTTIETDEAIDKLPPNCKALNNAAKNRIKQYTNTVGVSPELLHTELAIRIIKDNNGMPALKAFRDYHVHRVLENSNIKKKKLSNSTSREWYEIDLQTVLKAIDAVKKNVNNLSNTASTSFIPIVFRPEQEEAIEKTISQFKKGNRMLWNAKMRFGKTLCALEVVRKSKFKKTIIITHRPVVDDGWYSDFGKIFINESNYIYGSKNSGYTVEQLLKQEKNFVYFASIQDLRGSDAVGGKFGKNSELFSLDWDFVIVDEAHEGTTTALGNDVIKKVVKDGNGYDTKFLALSGTPFNILNDYDENIYTWDYVMEQQSKKEWDINYFGDSNPYDELPELKIYTYDLGKIIDDAKYVELEDKAFNFREFFRVWTGDISIDRRPMPDSSLVGEFYHEKDIRSFLDLITKENPESQYPYSNEKYRNLFKHSLWMVPGVKEAKSLSKMMRKHPVFGSGAFDIVNVAGDGDEEEKNEDALKKVRDAIKRAGDGYTITLSCGKLTTGVTVPEWTAVFMLSGSFSTSAANYLQTIFRVQSPCNISGKIKKSCYVFDFAPDRTLKMVAEAVALSTKAGKANASDKKILGAFLNYCPVISVDGTVMKEYDTNKLLQQLKRAYADRAVKNGFDDTNLYNDELLKLEDVDIEKFNKLKGIIGKSKATPKSNEIDINHQGFTNEEYEEVERIKKKSKKTITPEEEERLKEINEQRKQKNNAISILRGISIRMPLLIYGADIDINEDITMENLVDIVDDSSWDEFMPVGVSKDIFKSFIKYYDAEIFIAAGRKIRDTVRSADELSPTERVKKITDLFSNFKNPDKETVLTPWRVVNMHMSDCLGGYNFYDGDYTSLLETPRFVDQGQVTKDTLANADAKILEINSKTGLYPLYVTYSIFRSKCATYSEDELDHELLEVLWNETVQQNIFVICKTPMAKSITKRTLIGFKNTPVNAHYFDDLINMLRNKQTKFVDRVLKANYWKKEGKKMKFDAVVGNPPYQVMDGGTKTSASPIYNKFVESSKALNPRYISMITPARWYVGGKGLDSFRTSMLNDNHITHLIDFPNSNDVFPTVDIAGGVSYFLWEKDTQSECEVVNCADGTRNALKRSLDEYDVFIRSNKAISIVRKTLQNHKGTFMDNVVSASKPFGLRTFYQPKESGIPCQFIQKIGLKYADPNDVKDQWDLLNKWKLLAPRSPIAGQTDFTKPVGFYYDGNTRIVPPGTCCTESFLVLFASDSKDEVLSFKTYLFSKVFRFLLLQCVVSQDVIRDKFKFVPHLGNYSGSYTDEMLCKMWDITEEEWQYIDSRIHNYEK
jgi:hypothetical protein